jgi:preprotein translocase subunit YajC
MSRLIPTLAAAGVFLAASSAFSQGQDPKTNPNPNQNTDQVTTVTTLRGKVVRVEGQDRIVVKTSDNRDVILMANPTTRYVINGKAGRFADLRTGVDFRATYNLQNKQYIVSSIQAGEGFDVDTQPGINERKFRGRVVKVDAATNQIVAKSQDGKEVTLYVQKTGRFLRNGQAVRMADIQVGTVIEAQYLERDNHWWVDEVLLVTDVTDPAAQGTQVQGTVVRVVGTNQVIVRTNDNKEVTIELVPQTVYTFDNQPAQLRDIQAGQDIRIQYDVRDRRSIASRIFGVRRNK